MVRNLLINAGRRLLGEKFPPSRFPQSIIRMRDSTYSPWLADSEFQLVHTKVQNYTMIEEPRLYELWTLARQARRLDGALIEVGCWRGGAGCMMAAAAKAPVLMCDTFKGVVKTGRQDNTYLGGEHADASEENVRELARSLAVEVEILSGIFPDETGSSVSDRRFAMCHIDVDTYRSAKDAAEWLWPRVLPGGVVVFDDYGCATCDGIRDCLHEWMPARDRLMIHNLNGHAVVVKLG